jgi:hypothetical protein
MPRIGMAPRLASGRGVIDLGFSTLARDLEIFGLDGRLRYRVLVPAGASQALLPAALASHAMVLRVQELP